MRKLVLILVALIAVVTFIRAYTAPVIASDSMLKSAVTSSASLE